MATAIMIVHISTKIIFVPIRQIFFSIKKPPLTTKLIKLYHDMLEMARKIL